MKKLSEKSPKSETPASTIWSWTSFNLMWPSRSVASLFEPDFLHFLRLHFVFTSLPLLNRSRLVFYLWASFLSRIGMLSWEEGTVYQWLSARIALEKCDWYALNQQMCNFEHKLPWTLSKQLFCGRCTKRK